VRVDSGLGLALSRVEVARVDSVLGLALSRVEMAFQRSNVQTFRRSNALMFPRQTIPALEIYLNDIGTIRRIAGFTHLVLITATTFQSDIVMIFIAAYD
jgi:hypothetical protein